MEETKELVVKENVEIENGQLMPRTFDGLYRIANIMANSGMVPASYAHKPEAIFVAVQMGMEVGLRPMQAIQNIAVVNGKPTIYADGITGLLHASKKVEYIKERFMDKAKEIDPADLPLDLSEWSPTLKAVCEIKRIGSDQQLYRGSFSVADAMRMGKWNKPQKQGKSVWQKHPARMLMWRARSYAARDGFSDVLKGLAAYEEVIDYDDDADYTVTETKASPELLHENFKTFCKANDLPYDRVMEFVTQSAQMTSSTTEAIIEQAGIDDDNFIKRFMAWDNKRKQLEDSSEEPVSTPVEEPKTTETEEPEPVNSCDNCDVPGCTGCKTVEVGEPVESKPEPVAEEGTAQIIIDMMDHLADVQLDPTIDYPATFYNYVAYVSEIQEVDQADIINMWNTMGAAKWVPYFLNYIAVPDALVVRVGNDAAAVGASEPADESAPAAEEPADVEPESENCQPEEDDGASSGEPEEPDNSSEAGTPDSHDDAPKSFLSSWLRMTGKDFFPFVTENPSMFDPNVISDEEFKKAVDKWNNLVRGKFSQDNFPYLEEPEIKKPEATIGIQYFNMRQDRPDLVSKSLEFRGFANGGLSDDAKKIVIQDVLDLMSGKKLTK